jgi:serine/threonine-protein kinase
LLYPNLPLGTRLAGRYTVDQVLGQGGFGITYAATDTALGRQVALKEFFPDGSTRQVTRLMPPTSLGGLGFEEAKQRFIEEARTLAQFAHPGIVKVFDVFEENGTAYLVMELLQGQTLGQRIAQMGRLPEQEVLQIALKVADALQTVHQAGLLHRDIKPDNLFLVGDKVVLIDFGTARVFAKNRTVAHTRMVTPGYAPLEQYASSAKLGPYTDIYALGATLFHALTGAAPPTATDRATGVHLPALPRATSPALTNLLGSSLGMKITERPANVAQWLEALNQPAPPPVQPPPRPQPTYRRRGWAEGCAMGCSTFVVVSLLAVIVAKSVAFIWVAPFLALMVAIVVANSRK